MTAKAFYRGLTTDAHHQIDATHFELSNVQKLCPCQPDMSSEIAVESLQRE